MADEPTWPLPKNLMLAEIEWAFLPDEVQSALVEAAMQISHATDYVHVQVTFDNVQELRRPKVHAIVPKLGGDDG